MSYANGKIYKIVCNETGRIYVGSTTTPLRKRLGDHVSKFKQWKKGNTKTYYTSFEILETGNYDIILLEAYPCSSKEELHARERKWIEELGCVNKILPTRTYKEWVGANEDAIRQYHKQYREANKDAISQRMKEWREANQETIRQYREANKDAINLKAKEVHQCGCGGRYTSCHKARHERSQKHKAWLES